MKQKNSNTAVLIFAHSAEYEATVKPFQYSKEVFECLNARTLQLVKKTNLPYFLITENEQTGATFGDRFTNAMQSVYDLGYQSLIVIGNDTPHLQSSQLIRACKQLADNKTVVGSSLDGGFYLLGIHKEHFDTKLFLALPWQTPQLSSVLSNVLSVNTTTITYLKKLADVDTYLDIKKIIDSFRTVFKSLFKLLLVMLSSIKNRFAVVADSLSFLLHSTSYNKGSPVCV